MVMPTRKVGEGRHRPLIAACLAVGLTLSGCSGVPSDPDGTLERVSGGVLRVGASPDDGLVQVIDHEVSGSEVELVEAFADDLNADVEWTVGGEENLVFDLKKGQLDLVIGGITDQTPWVDSAGVSRAYPGIPGSGGRQIVMLVPLGENRFLSTLERFLDSEVGP
jgi:ABC-type amino acid transport substrate-binding protein